MATTTLSPILIQLLIGQEYTRLDGTILAHAAILIYSLLSLAHLVVNASATSHRLS